MSKSGDHPPSLVARLLRLADRDPGCAAALAQRRAGKAHGAGPAGPAWSTYAHGYALLRWEHLDEAERLLRQAQGMFAALGLTLAALHARCAVLLARLPGGAPELQAEWERLAADYAGAGSPLDAARAAMYQCWHRTVIGWPREALELARQIRPVIERAGSPADLGRLLRITAAAHDACGQLEQALALIDQALAVFAPARLPVETARCLVERAWYLQHKETFGPALENLQQARAIFARYQMGWRLANCDQHLGLLVSRLGRYDEALARTLRARAAFLGLGRADSAALCTMNLGTVAYYSGLFDLALVAYQRAEAVYSELGHQGPVLVSRRNQAMVLRAAGRLDAALSMLLVLLPLAEAAGRRTELAEIHQALGQTLRDLLRYDEALDHLRAAETLFGQVDNAAASARCRLEQGMIYLALSEHTTAQDCLLASEAALAERPFHRWRAGYGLGLCAEHQGQDALALQRYQQACATVSQLRQRVVSEHASSGIFEQARKLYLDALRLALRSRQPQALLSLAEQQRALVLARHLSGWLPHRSEPAPDSRQHPFDLETVLAARARPEQLEALIHTAVEHVLGTRHPPIDVDDPPVSDVSLDELRRQCSAVYPAGWTTLVFVPCDETLITVVCGPDGDELVAAPFDEGLRRCLAKVSLPQYRRYTYQDIAHQQGDTAQPWAVFAELGERLIPAPVRGRLRPGHRLLIVAGGELHHVPWAALRLGPRWLVELATIQLVPGLRLWSRLAARPAPGADALVLGVRQSSTPAQPLDRALASLDLVESLWPGRVERWEEGAASRQNLLDRAAAGGLARHRLLHMACHGQLVADRGLFAHLKLADGDLFYEDVLRLDLAGALVVLAACEGATSEVLPGEEVLSLSRAFLAAGARDVVASLWQLYDSTVMELLQPFYRALTQGADAPSALAQAQRALIVRADAPEPSERVLGLPLVWASLCVIGAGV